MDKQLNLVLKLSLEEMALRSVVANLWIDIINEDETENANIGELGGISEKVKGKVSKLGIPKPLKIRMMHVVKPIGSDILNWKTFHEGRLSDSDQTFDVHILKQLCWKSERSVDYHKTAERLLHLETVSAVKRFKLACWYCLENYIPVLWEETTEKYKSNFNDKLIFQLVKEIPLDCYWGYVLKHEEAKLNDFLRRRLNRPLSFQQYIFKLSARQGNKAATEYFFQKLTDEERHSFLVDAACDGIEERRNLNEDRSKIPKEKISETVCYLLSVMSSSQQIRVLSHLPNEVLSCVLDWPLQDLFLDIADIVWTFLPEEKYNNLLWNIIDYFRQSDYFFPNLFQKFFQSSPNSFRRCFVNKECAWSIFFCHLFHTEDEEAIKVVFRHVDARDKVRLVSCSRFLHHFDKLIDRGHWHLVELCLREAQLSKEGRERVRLAFKRFLTEMADQEEAIMLRWKRFFEFLDAREQENKRSLEDDAQTLSNKKLH